MIERLSFTRDWKQAAACPAAWHAQRVSGIYSPPPKPCYATGSLWHAALLTPDRIPAVYAEYGDLITLQKAGKTGQKGDPNADARQAVADGIYTRSVPQVAEMLEGGRCEVAVEWECGGLPWVCHVDLLAADGCVLDGKTCKDITGTQWSPVQRRYIPWHEALLYWHQLAVYRRALGPETVPAVGLIACQSTADIPDVRVIASVEGDEDILDQYAALVEKSMSEPWESPLTGLKLPPFRAMMAAPLADMLRCEEPDCGWCRRSRQNVVFPHRLSRAAGL